MVELCITSVCQSSKLDDKQALAYYLKLDLSQSKCSQFIKTFGKRPKGSGRCLTIPLNVRGASMNPFEAVRICHWFYFLGSKDQATIRNCHTALPAGEKRRRKPLLDKAVKHLTALNTKGAAVVELEEGYAIANKVGFDLLSNEGYSTNDERRDESEEEVDSLLGPDSSDEDEDENNDDDNSGVFDHVGIGSREEEVENYIEARRARFKKIKKKRRVSEPPTKPSQLCNAMNNKSELRLFKRFAKHLDITFLPQQPRNAPKRTAILIILNEVKDNSNAGGRLRKKIRRNVKKIQILSNNKDETKYIFSHIKRAFKKESEHQYEVEELHRPNTNTSMCDLVENYITAKKKERANPTRKRRNLGDIANDIDGRGHAGGTAISSEVPFRHSL